MTSNYLDKILKTNVLREPILKSAVAALDLPLGSTGLDAGCGPGLQCLLLAKAVGVDGRVTGLDVSPEFLAYGKKLAEEAGMTGRIDFVEGSVASIPRGGRVFDWVWSADFVGYGPLDPMPLLEELKRVTKHGGTLAILAWSFENLLPGYPQLEAKLRATKSGLAPFKPGMRPSRHFLRALGWFRKLGLIDAQVRVFSGCAHASLTEDEVTALKLLFEMRWEGVEGEPSEADRGEYERLCRPDSPDFIVTHPDYCAFFSYTMFSGTVV